MDLREESWFRRLFGAEELCSEINATSEAYDATQRLFRLELDFTRSAGESNVETLVAPNGRRFRPGRFETPTLSELRARGVAHIAGFGTADSAIFVDNVVRDVRSLHMTSLARGAVFQVASQFNCLEFVQRGVIPEFGVRGYELDQTQGPACALACAASTVWRNYFMPMGHSEDGIEIRGQRSVCQLNCLADVQALLGEDLIQVENGYTSSTRVEDLAAKINAMTEEKRDQLRGALRVGVQWDAEVTDCRDADIDCRDGDIVTQVFCSALSVGSSAKMRHWKALAELVLEASYEATLAIAAENLHRGISRDVYLTLLGGGAFGNGPKWIEGAIRRALKIYRFAALRVHIVHRSDGTPFFSNYRALTKEYCEDIEEEVGERNSADEIDDD